MYAATRITAAAFFEHGDAWTVAAATDNQIQINYKKIKN
jgi:hypothetical protein